MAAKTMTLYMNAMMSIKQLTAGGCKQLSADIGESQVDTRGKIVLGEEDCVIVYGPLALTSAAFTLEEYICNVLSTFDVEPLPALSYASQILCCDPAR